MRTDPTPIRSLAVRSEPPIPTDDTQQALRLDEAVLCVDCNVLSNVTRDVCPSCGSRARFPVQRWIDRTIRPRR